MSVTSVKLRQRKIIIIIYNLFLYGPPAIPHLFLDFFLNPWNLYSILIQRFNDILLLDSFVIEEEE